MAAPALGVGPHKAAPWAEPVKSNWASDTRLLDTKAEKGQSLMAQQQLLAARTCSDLTCEVLAS